MRKWRRLSVLILCLALTVLLPVTAMADSREEQLLQDIARMYRRTMAENGLEQLGGYCGILAGYQLYYLGVDAWPDPHNGNDEYDLYCNREYSSGGYKIRAYPASQYTLEEALNLITHGGTRDAYNILVGFQWTDTASGGDFGHAVVIPAILGGVVYSVESYYSEIGGNAGTPFRCSIAEFAAEYSSWTVLDGVIWFGEKEYANFCEEYATDMFVQAKSDTKLLQQPGPLTLEGQQVLRLVAAGERLRVTALYKNRNNQYFYRVEEEGKTAYVAAKNTACFRINTENVSVSDLQAPETLREGEHFFLQGKITAKDSMLTGIQVVVNGERNTPMLAYTLEHEGRLIRLDDSELNSAIDFSALAAGVYTYQVYADVTNAFYLPRVKGGKVTDFHSRVLLYSSEFRILGEDEEAPEPVQETEEPVQSFDDGWSWTEDTWYYYQDGAPRSGWFCDHGINYYLNEDGSAVTGWVTINGQTRYFTETGAMCTGWVTTQDGRLYMLSNGIAARGWRTVNDSLYYFAEDTGVALSDCWFEWKGAQYYFLTDGKAATGWTDLPEGSFYFREDGVLQAKYVTVNGQTYVQVVGSDSGATGRVSAAGGK